MTKKSSHTRTRQDARSIACHVLNRLEADDAYANLLLPKVLGQSELSNADKSFVTDTVYGTLRWRLFLDAVIEAAHKKPIRTINVKLINIVRLGTYQWLFMNGADYACVSETVSLARRTVGAQTAGFINVLMRKITSYNRQQWEVNVTSRIQRSNTLSADDVLIARQSVRFSHPQWIVRELKKAWDISGYAWDNTQGDPIHAMLGADNEAPSVTLCVRPGLADLDEVYDQAESKGAVVARGDFSPYALRLRGINPARIRGVKNSTVGVEDEGSQLAALALASAQSLNQTGSEQWLDMCAGPGGKTALLASLAAQRGAHITANEPHEHRRKLVEENLQAIPEGVVTDVLGLDGVQFGVSYRDRFDKILVDAPCSGLGALRRRPEARWRKTPESIIELCSLQKKLLSSALDAVKPGGVVAYVTCSPVVAETRDIVEAVLSERHNVERVDVPEIMKQIAPHIPVPQPRADGSAQDMQLFEHIHNTDQMFIALLRRTR
ncbi:transcription antitermination factor NusB [Alloscardovia omnicolens]|uniref:transcription antitermination factor NusB n=1 Tax=Alloscardovia omnicolens TaxID=419015 RepID=UPI003A7256CF